ncbi:nitronate monooxygenase [uncultured Thalassospira sp.]|uniref:NAD(P)H-dependent flavin oxidoreductase n=1 Tax=uncultured Thalassospira sp. TaxID=404382 RepID=UPI00258E5D0F|nr:nitronate monooxygenase [uncultured Thalassospira sp.]
MNKTQQTVDQRVAALKSRMHLPVISAPMFLVSGPDMVIAASKAGVMGALPGPNARSIEDLRGFFEAITREIGPDDAPWAFNMITHTSYGRFDEELALVSEFKPELVITALGGPHRVSEAVHAYGGLVFADVNSPKYARKAIEKGADGLVLVCSGAGGHTGEYAMMPFIEEVRSFFDGPLIVGGGIGNGRAIRATEILGVDFAYIGTRFLNARETMIQDEYRKMLIKSSMEDIIASRAITGALGNWMKASIDAAGISMDHMKSEAKIDFSGDMHDGNKAWKNVWSAGQGVGQITASEPMADIVASLQRGYDATFTENQTAKKEMA